MGALLVPQKPASTSPVEAVHSRADRVQELWAGGRIDAPTYFGMLFFHGIESAVKKGSALPAARAAYDELKSTLRSRTCNRGHAYGFGDQAHHVQPHLDEAAWEARGLGVDTRCLAGFADLVEASARSAALKAGLDCIASLPGAFLRFVRLDLSVRVASSVPGEPMGARESLGGEPDSAHFFSFAELALWCLDREPEDPFWMALARAAVAAQPSFLGVHFMAARRAPRTAFDYGPQDVLRNPWELRRRLAGLPPVEDLGSTDAQTLGVLAGRNARAGLIGEPLLSRRQRKEAQALSVASSMSTTST